MENKEQGLIDEFTRRKYNIHNVDECDCCEHQLNILDKVKSSISKYFKARKAELEKGCKKRLSTIDWGLCGIKCANHKNGTILCSECQARLAQLKEDAEMLGVLLE